MFDRKYLRLIIPFGMILLGFVPGQIEAQYLNSLPEYDPEKVIVKKDWLIDSIEQKASLYADGSNMVMTNGLISRIFSINQDATTIGLDNLMNGESMLRSIRPEGELVVDGITVPIGGLLGQPVHNYLLPEWIPYLHKNPAAFHLIGFETTATMPRFEWKKRPEWMPKDIAWPAPGVALDLIYQAQDDLIESLIKRKSTDAGRELIFYDPIDTLDENWTLHVSESYEGNAISNEDTAGEILAMPNQSVFAELRNPKGSDVWIVKIYPGTDQSTSWGPGIALLGNRVPILKFNIRTADHTFGYYDGNEEHQIGSWEGSEPIWLRIESKDDYFQLSYSRNGESYNQLRNVAPRHNGLIRKIRIGKTDGEAGALDEKVEEDVEQDSLLLGRSHIKDFRILGEISVQTRAEMEAKYEFLKNLTVKVHYEIYDGIPMYSKWISVENTGDKAVTIEHFKSEMLALTEPESSVDNKEQWLLPNITVESDYRFGGMSNENVFETSVAWNEDPLYTTQVNYTKKMPTLLEVYPKMGPQKVLQPNEKFTSYRVWELFHKDRDRERNGLALRRLYRSQAPWVTENPILMHVRNADDASVKMAIDQCAEVGFEMVIMTFGSGFSIEDTSEQNMLRMMSLTDYAHSKGIALGGYSLLASRSIDAANDVVMPAGQTPRFNQSPCLGSKWGEEYFNKIYNFFGVTSQDVLEHDGSYPGDVCASQDHPGHRGLEDSQWEQYEKISEFYKWCRANAIYLNVPDFYFMNGSNKTGMGYRETNWSLPREQQEIIERQNIYDGTWEKTPSMGWMFVPLVEYHGGGEAATIEPLHEHLDHYDRRMANLFGAGVQACYRGPQLYDSITTKAVVQKWVNFYKDHREVLDSDIIHIRRADGKDYDGILHVNPYGEEKGLVMVYNPLEQPIRKTIKVNAYYTGLDDVVNVTEDDGETYELSLDRSYNLELPIDIPARGYQWFILK
ncbi:DUF1349 domain-containing protein [Membranihabitans marinus]|uniref:DUF1349 domain-containing protein n=1 Tax=Membranihabitans marinus TaxID=1227546 RepID=UPI001F440670|nr:DUF1349 domain-containing protein [Membranihabitans marinus]